jgi:predicted dehydrogenase
MADGRRRILVVGLGSIGKRHARLLAARGDLDVHLCEPSATVLAGAKAELGELPAHGSLEEGLAARPEMVLIATPHHLHAAQSIASFKAGAHVLCEKPICVDAGEARQMIQAASEHKKTLCVGFHLHFQDGIRRVKEIIDSGMIGQVAHIHCRVGSLITLRNSLSRYQEKFKGALVLDYAHQPDLLLWLLGDLPAGVTMTGLQAGSLPHTSNPNVLALTLDYKRPVLATVHLNYIQMPQRHEYEVVGDKGWVLFDIDSGLIRIGLRETEKETQERVTTERDHAYRAEHEAFIQAVDGKRLPESPGDAAARSVELFNMAMRSWESGVRVACEWERY